MRAPPATAADAATDSPANPEGEKSDMHLITNVMDPKAQSLQHAAAIHKRRWGLELAFRACKHTLEGHTLSSHATEQARFELEWGLVCWPGRCSSADVALCDTGRKACATGRWRRLSSRWACRRRSNVTARRQRGCAMRHRPEVCATGLLAQNSCADQPIWFTGGDKYLIAVGQTQCCGVERDAMLIGHRNGDL